MDKGGRSLCVTRQQTEWELLRVLEMFRRTSPKPLSRPVVSTRGQLFPVYYVFSGVLGSTTDRESRDVVRDRFPDFFEIKTYFNPYNR